MESNKLKNVNNIDVKISGLKMLKKIGEGGMSMVYLAEQISLKRKVAVKVMRLEIAINDFDVQRFKHEAKTIARLDHPNIINIYNIGQTSKGEVYFTMPYLNHGDLTSYILESEKEFITLLMSICDGLGFAHTSGVVHRDIKPENLLFDKFGNIQIADFGIALSKEGSRMTKEHQIVGSAQYMSPEQARSQVVEKQTDIYSLGIVIYERLTGSVPFDADDSITVLVNHVSEEPPKLPLKMRHWQNLIDKCLAKLPKDRFQNMEELKLAIANIPVTSIQRTNSSIKNALNDEKGKHLKWFIPSLLILMIIGLYSYNEKKGSTIVQTKATILSNPIEKEVVATSQINPKINDDKKESIKYSPTKTTEISDTSSDTNREATKPEGESIANTAEDIQEESIRLNKGVEVLNISSSEAEDTKQVLPVQDNTELLLLKAAKNIEKYRLSKPKGDNATDQLLEIIAIHPTHVEALQALESVGGKYFQLVKSALNKGDFNKALKHSRALQRFNSKTKFINKNFNKQKKLLFELIAKQDLSAATISIERVNTLSRTVKIFNPEHPLISHFVEVAKIKTAPKIGESLLDELGIETILVTNKLAVSINEITIEQYTEFSSATTRTPAKCRQNNSGLGGLFKKLSWKKTGFNQTEDHPVACITQSDAHAYVKWLSDQTTNSYRLPTQQEWLAIAAKENNSFKPCQSGNLTGSEAIKIRNKEDKFSCNDKFKYTAPVSTFKVNKIGLFDINGNVSEWVACKQPCAKPIAMGSSWHDGKQSNKVDKSSSHKPSSAFTTIGFRLVRDL